MISLIDGKVFDGEVLLGDLSVITVTNNTLCFRNASGDIECENESTLDDSAREVVAAWRALYSNGVAVNTSLDDYKKTAIQKISDDSGTAMLAGFYSTINATENDDLGNPKARLFGFQFGDQANWTGGLQLINYILTEGLENIPDCPMKAQLVIQPAIPAVVDDNGVITQPAVPAQLIGLNAKCQGGAYQVFTIEQYRKLVFIDAASHQVYVLGKAGQLRDGVNAATTIEEVDQVMQMNVW